MPGMEDWDMGGQPPQETPADTVAPAHSGQAAGAEIQGGPVQDTALNGAQVGSLLQVLENVAIGKLPKASATAIIQAAFPAMSPDMVRGMVEPIEIREPVPVQPATPKPKEADTDQPSFAEVDELTDQVEVASQGAWERLLEPVRRLVANAASFEEIREGILELYPEMDAEAISETLTNAMTAAFNRGRASVK